MERRVNKYGVLYVPTVEDTEGTRHIIPGRDCAPLCEREATGEQWPPQSWSRSNLCQRCVQRYIRKAEGIEAGWGWQEETP